MKILSPVLGQFANGEYAWWCPGCGHAHHVPALVGEKVDGLWQFHGNVEKPTLTPSVRHFYTQPARPPEQPEPTEVTTCHYHLTDGQILFQGDCRHALNGKTVAMVPLADHQDYGWPE